MDILFLLLPLLLLFYLVSRTRKQQRALADAQTSATPGTEVMTTAGLYARVVEVEGDVVVLETAPGQRSRWARQVIARVVTPAEGTGATAAAPADLPAAEADLPGTDRDAGPGGARPQGGSPA